MKVWKVAKLMETESESDYQELGGGRRRKVGSTGIKFQFSKKKSSRELCIALCLQLTIC